MTKVHRALRKKMNPNIRDSEEHLGEGDLVRYLDSEMRSAERAQVATHLIGCARCAAALESIRTDRHLLAEYLVDTEPPALDPARRRAALARVEAAAHRQATRSWRADRRAMAKAAAVGALVVVSAFATSPVRAWVADLFRSVSDRVERLAATSAVVTPPEAIVLRSSTTIGYVPSGDTFLIDIRSHQAEGTLILGVGQGASVTVRAVGGDDTVELVRLPSGMQIENRPEHRGDYAVNLPSTLAQVRVRVGGSGEVVFGREDLSASWISVVDLSAEFGGSAPGSARP
jgi:anti-sigma factor RsiW